MKKKKRTTAEVKRMKNKIMTQLAEKKSTVPDIANIIGSRPPYMYTSLCPDPRFRVQIKEATR